MNAKVIPLPVKPIHPIAWHFLAQFRALNAMPTSPKATVTPIRKPQ